MNIAIVGATGKVGQIIIKVLQERNIHADNFYLFASHKSEGKVVQIYDKNYVVEYLCEENIKSKKIDYALFSAGGTISRTFAPIFVSYGAIVVDNSSSFRQEKSVPLVVPEVNKEDLLSSSKIISNPNCSTIQAVLPLKVLDNKYGLKRVVFSTYQAVSGAGQQGTLDLQNGINGLPPKKFVYPIFNNILPHIDDFLDTGYTKEEQKMIFETKKILHRPNLRVTATTVRVPVFDCHSESINIELKKDFDIEQVKKDFSQFQNLVVVDDISKNIYPMPINCVGKDEVFVGRIRRDYSVKNGLNIFVVADNIRKGAGTNAVQILQELLKLKENK